MVETTTCAIIGGGPAGMVLGLLLARAGVEVTLLEKHGDRLLDGWIFAARTNPVDCVWVGGRKWVEAGQHRARELIVARYRRSIARLLAADL